MMISIASYDSLTKNARDSQRKSDLKTIQSGLEQYYHDQGFYPAASSFPFASPLRNTTGNPASPAPSPKAYINNLPQEAVYPSSSPYLYLPSPFPCDNSSATNQCRSYCLYATVENSNNAAFAASPAPCNDTTKGNYSVVSP